MLNFFALVVAYATEAMYLNESSTLQWFLLLQVAFKYLFCTIPT